MPISIKGIRSAGVPLAIIETADPTATILSCIRSLNGAADTLPIVRWDSVGAFSALSDPGNDALRRICNESDPGTVTNPTEALAMLARAPKKTLAFVLNGHRFWNEPTCAQAIWNLRDSLKPNGSTVILLCPSTGGLPDEIKSDIVVLTDPLPTPEEVDSIITEIVKAAGQDPTALTDRPKLTDTLLGLSAFAVEQCLALSITREGIDRPGLWDRKRKMIEQTPGLSVWRGGEKFKDIGGYDNAKTFMANICAGNGAPRSIVFIDEIEKSLAGITGDTSGVSQDYLRCLLTYMQDKDTAGVIFIGPPGSGKSAVAKACGNEAGIPTIALDLGGMKGSLVGESERRLRTALQVTDAVSQGSALFVATCNSIGILPPELRRRFSLGTFFFSLPTLADRIIIWQIYLKKFKLPQQDRPPDEGWTGAEIRNCCLIAWRLKCSLTEAAKFIVPVSVSAQDAIDKLCRDAHRRYISASKPGLYEYERYAPSAGTSRRMEV